jgi:hypothetical protein
VHLQPDQISDLQCLFQQRIDVGQVRQESLSIDISFAAEDLIAIDSEIVEEIFLLGFGFLDKRWQTGFERFRFTGMHFEVRMQTDKVGDVIHHLSGDDFASSRGRAVKSIAPEFVERDAEFVTAAELAGVALRKQIDRFAI